MSILAYRYGVRVLQEHTVPPETWEQLERRTLYWNRLVELDREYRRKMDEVVAPHLPAEGTQEEQTAARKAALRRPEIMAALALAQQEVYSAQRQLRGASACYWGNYLDVEQSWATARQRNPRQMRLQSPSAREGTLSVHFQGGGLRIEKLWRDNNLLQIEPPPAGAYELPRGERRRATWAEFRFRVASTSDREPVWLTGSVCLHRPLPETGIVRRAHLVIERHHAHPYPRYTLVVVVEQPDAPSMAASGRVWGVDVGWRLVEGGMRVALACAADGEVRELALPERLLGAFAWADRYRAGRDLQRNAIRAALVDYRDTRRQPLPEWLAGELRNLGQWDSPGRFRWLYYQWRERRHNGDEEVFGRLEGWERQDRHLAACVAGAQRRAAAYRENLVGIWLKALMADAGVVAVEDTNWRELSQTVEEYGPQGQQRRIASAGRLLERLKQVGEREGVTVLRVPAPNTTRVCSWCGHLNDQSAALWVRCMGCERTYDQDHNAARNLLAAASGEGVSAGSTDRSRKPARWKRIQEGAAEHRRALADMEAGVGMVAGTETPGNG